MPTAGTQSRYGSDTPSPWRAHQQHTAVAVLHVCGMDDGVQQQALCIY